jgi:mono/diheme cytochrome c family protein
MLLAAALVVCAGNVHAQQAKPFDLGKREYDSNCVNCHGPKGQGDGSRKPFLTTSSTDLTLLSRKNGGVFPFDRVYSIIDGREQIGAHGPRNMPVWGSVYNLNAAEAYIDVPQNLEASAREAYVRNRIRALTEYIERLQMR